jgi:hypothetical protein
MRTLGNVSYMLGVAFLIAAMAVNAIPAPQAQAAPGFVCHEQNGWTIWEPQPGTFHQIEGAISYCAKAGSTGGGGQGCTAYDVSGSFSYVQGVINTAGNCGLSHWGYMLGDPTSTPTNTNTPTNTPTHTSTNTPTNTPTDTPTNTPTDTPTNTPTETQEQFTPTVTNTPTDTPTGTLTATNTATNTPTNTATETQEAFTPTVTNTPTNTVTDTPTITPTTPPQPLIPVTGANLGGGWKNSTIFFNLGIAFLGLGLVLNGLARERRQREI